MANDIKGKFRDRMKQQKRKYKIIENSMNETTKDNIIEIKPNFKVINDCKYENKPLKLPRAQKKEKKKVFELKNIEKKDSNIEVLIEKNKIKEYQPETKEIEQIILKNKIIKKIEKSIQDKKSELDIIDSQIYILSKLTDEVKTKEEIKKQKEQIQKLQNKLKKIKEQLKIYINDDVIYKAIDLDERSLIDDVLDYKRMLESDTSLKEEYVTIKELTYLIEEIDKVNDRCIELDNKKNKELEKLNINDEQFIELENKILKEDEISQYIKNKVDEQTEEILMLEQNIEKIETRIEVVYNYELLERLISLELKYLALLSLSPLYHTLPFIALTASTTKDMINMLRNTKLVRSEEKISYYAKDYEKNIEELSYKINDIEKMLTDSLYSISNIKEEFSNNYLIKSDYRYDEFIKKTEKMENILKENLSKVGIHKIKMYKNKNKNKEKIKKVSELNIK